MFSQVDPLKVLGMTVKMGVNIFRNHNKALQMECVVELKMVSLRAVNL